MKNIEYNENAILELETAIKEEKNIRTYKRISVALKHYQGRSNRSISQINGIDVHFVAKYIKSYKNEGLGALTSKKSPEALRKLTIEQKDKIAEVIINNTPDEVGLIVEKTGLLN